MALDVLKEKQHWKIEIIFKDNFGNGGEEKDEEQVIEYLEKILPLLPDDIYYSYWKGSFWQIFK